jgi:hypothetical protein
MRGLGIRLGIIGAIVVGALILRPFLTGNAGDLNVGDCFDEPTATAETVEDVQHHPCTDLHTAEVVFIGSLAASTYPNQDDLDQWVLANCLPAYNAYTGTDLMTNTAGRDMTYFWPTSDGWTKGDRKVICYAVQSDGSQTKGSLKKS